MKQSTTSALSHFSYADTPPPHAPPPQQPHISENYAQVGIHNTNHNVSTNTNTNTNIDTNSNYYLYLNLYLYLYLYLYLLKHYDLYYVYPLVHSFQICVVVGVVVHVVEVYQHMRSVIMLMLMTVHVYYVSENYAQ